MRGTGPGRKVVAEGLKVLKAVEQKGEGSFNFIPFDLGGERYLRTGDILPETELSALKKMDAIYLVLWPSGGKARYSGERVAAKIAF